MMIWDLADNSVVHNKLLEVPFGLSINLKKTNAKYFISNVENYEKKQFKISLVFFNNIHWY